MFDKSARSALTDQGRARRTNPASTALSDRLDLALRCTGVELARPTDLVLGIGDHLVELRDPADGSRQSEDRREERDRNADRALDDSRIKVDVRIELAGDE